MDRIADIAGRMKGWLYWQFRNADNYASVIDAIAGEVQALEDALFDVLTKRMVSNAVGAQLDQWGKLVGEPRNGKSDALYRHFIRVRVLRNTSQGTPERLIAVLKGLTDADKLWFTDARSQDSWHTETVSGVCFVSWDGPTIDTELAKNLKQILESVAPAGVRIGKLAQGNDNTFRFDTTGQGFDEGKFARLL